MTRAIDDVVLKGRITDFPESRARSAGHNCQIELCARHCDVVCEGPAVAMWRPIGKIVGYDVHPATEDDLTASTKG